MIWGRAVGEMALSRRQSDAVTMLRAQIAAPLPRAVLHGQGIRELADLGLIQRSGIPGIWAITDEGRNVDLDAVTVPDWETRASRPTWYISPTPEAKTAALLEHSFSLIDGLKPGDELFGQVVRASAMDRLHRCGPARKFVYFAYPVGFALKHIAWAVRVRSPMWTEHNVNVCRSELRLPATRHKELARSRAEVKRAQQADEALRAQLMAEGCTEWEVEEYFALRSDRRPVL